MVPAIPIVSLTICVFSGFLIFTKRPRYAFDSIYAVFTICMAFPHLGHLLLHRWEWDQEFLRFSTLFTFTYGPLLFLYIRTLTEEGDSFRKWDLLHFLPFAILEILFAVHFFREGQEEIPPSPGEWRRPEKGFHFAGAFLSVSMTVYSIWIFLLLNRHGKKLRDHFSNIDSIKDLRWMYWVLVLFMISTGIHWFLEWVHVSDASPETFNPRVIRGAGVLAFSVFFCWFGVRQTVVYTHRELDTFKGRKSEEEGPTDPDEERRKYEKSGLREDKIPEYLKKIRDYMQNEKPYKESEFSIDSLSEGTGIPRFYITQILNETLKTNFYNFANEYRIKDVMNALQSSSEEKPNILRLALEYGFNSKSTFNTSFKKIVGKTPSQFLEEVSEVA
ncbi:helix-turn-helix domain-containing protein [Leptospira langatensis]|uniref:Helix-turn-helix domain-containing protein n=1 Tax=Leptospira langatensis TaxID=2484983 RepID=A0A5F1ZUA3_9LEPT|nr:helix-turn-helix domain-containing protein [Leptospira langatensis]TGJ98972.1 helix-turn-helix domain-containing protein [Leptospira langatensis]TGL40756.1 helix-turn-helix domain-containing protein [Leptospira langatensis]